MEILFEDKNIIVATKDAGVLSQADSSGRENMVTLLTDITGGEVYCVHRLDTATSGILAFAKNPKAAGKLTEAIAESEKIYFAAVSGKPQNGVMKDLLLHDKRLNKAFVVDRMRKGVKEASLEYETIAENKTTSLVKVKLHTGRTHQIRVQFASRGYPLLGDGKYGSKEKCPLALRAVSLEFFHPFSGERMKFENYPPSPWYDLQFDTEGNNNDKE